MNVPIVDNDLKAVLSAIKGTHYLINCFNIQLNVPSP